jgi:competence ComEA-like helix-hairpin-helix protein
VAPVKLAANHAAEHRLDINRATMEQFEALPGVGVVLARRIIEARNSRGPFRTIEDLRDVKGIGEKRLAQLRPLLIASPVTTRGAEQRAAGLGKGGKVKGL